MNKCRWMSSLVGLLTTATLLAEDNEPRFEFTRLVAHWAKYDDPGYLSFIEDAQPDVAQIGFYGAHFWSLAHTDQFNGYPAHFPVKGLDPCGRWFVERNKALHDRDVKVVGHFNVEFLVGDPAGEDGPRGFFKFYRDLWDEDLLGPKPVADPLEFLEQDATGKPILQNSYSIGGMAEHWACLRNPAWQTVMKAWVKVGIKRGVDGFIANYFYRHNCLCEHCQREFREHLANQFQPAQLRDKFGIENVRQHKFDELVCWHDPAKTTPLKLEMLRWSQISNKRVFDEVFVRYGRSIKPDLVVAQWNHVGNFGQINGDERCLLPAEMWARDEDYLWYSTGGSAHYTDLSKRFLGEGTLQARYIRGASGNKPFTLGKYESTRIRVAIAELAANGGAPMGFYTRFTDPAARKEIVRYYQFLRRHDKLYRGNRSHAEVLLLYPRKAVHAGNVEPVAAFRDRGTRLLDNHVLFDVLPDDIAAEKTRVRYRHVVSVDDAKKPGLDKLSEFAAPYTVRVSASRPAKGDELTLHFVNYNREEPPRRRDGRPSAGGGIVDEKPIATRKFLADVVIPQDHQIRGVVALTPEGDETPLDFTVSGNRVQFDVPSFLVYCAVRLHLNQK